MSENEPCELVRWGRHRNIKGTHTYTHTEQEKDKILKPRKKYTNNRLPIYVYVVLSIVAVSA